MTASVQRYAVKDAESDYAPTRHTEPTDHQTRRIVPRLDAGYPVRCCRLGTTVASGRGFHPATIPFRVTTGHRFSRAAGEGTAHGCTTCRAEVERESDWTPIPAIEASLGKGIPLDVLVYDAKRSGSIPGIRTRRGVSRRPPSTTGGGTLLTSPTTRRLGQGNQDGNRNGTRCRATRRNVKDQARL